MINNNLPGRQLPMPTEDIMEAQLRQVAIVHALELAKVMEGTPQDVHKLVANAKKIEEYIKGTSNSPA